MYFCKISTQHIGAESDKLLTIWLDISDDEIIITPTIKKEPFKVPEPVKEVEQVKTTEPVKITEPITEPVKAEPIEDIVVEDIESVDDRTSEINETAIKSENTTKSRLNQWETKLKEEKSNSLQRRQERKSLDLLGSLDDKKKNLFETFDPDKNELERPATVATVSLG